MTTGEIFFKIGSTGKQERKANMLKINPNFKTLWLTHDCPKTDRKLRQINQMAEKTPAPFHIAWIGVDTLWVHPQGVIALAYNAIPDVLAWSMETDVVIASGFCNSALLKLLATGVVSVDEAEPYAIPGTMSGIQVATLIAQLNRLDLKGCTGAVSQDRIRITGSDLDLSIFPDGEIHLVVQGKVALLRIG